MSASIESSLRLEIAQYQASLAKAQGDFKAFKDRISREGAGLGTAAFGGMQKNASKGKDSPMARQMGGVSMQIQDVAVQLQSGTKLTTVMAQQGSQLLSAFGTGGALAGGVLAVGLAAYTMGENSREAFKKFTTGAEEARAATRLLIAEATFENLTVGLTASRERAREISDELKKFETYAGAAGAWFAQLMGDKSAEEKIKALAKLKAEQDAAYGRIIEASLEDSTKQVEITRLRARGENDVADAKERALKLDRELARIEAMKAPVYAKEQLAADARAKAAEIEAAAARQTQEKKRLKDDEITRKRESLALSLREIQMLEAQAAGQDRKVKKMQEEAFIQKRAHELSAQGLDARASISMAQREWNARENIASGKGGRAHIGGVTRSRMMTSGLDQFKRNQEKEEQGFNESRWAGIGRGKQGFKNAAFDLQPTSFQLRGRMMGGGPDIALTERARRNADAADARGNRDTGALDLGGKIFELLQRNLE